MKWEDVGGLEDVKKSILDTVQVGSLYLLAFCIFIIKIHITQFRQKKKLYFVCFMKFQMVF